MRNAVLSFTLVLWLLGSEAAPANEQKYFKGHMHTFERAERFESIFGGSVTYLRPAGHDEFEIPEDAILLEGVISSESLNHVRRLILRKESSLVFLDSPGGDLLAGIKIGRLLHQTGATVVVTESSQCKSACALVFLGAKARVLAGTSNSLGFHRQYRIVDGQTVYGKVANDEALIDEYFRSIEISGIKADEVVATTGELSFSEASLVERGLVTVSAASYRATAKKLVAMSKMTYFELISSICTRYDAAKLETASVELLLKVLTCRGRVPANREPLLRVALSPWPLTQSQELELLSRTGVVEILRSTEPLAVEVFNIMNDVDGTDYKAFKQRRQQMREAQKR